MKVLIYHMKKLNLKKENWNFSRSTSGLRPALFVLVIALKELTWYNLRR